MSQWYRVTIVFPDVIFLTKYLDIKPRFKTASFFNPCVSKSMYIKNVVFVRSKNQIPNICYVRIASSLYILSKRCIWSEIYFILFIFISYLDHGITIFCKLIFYDDHETTRSISSSRRYTSGSESFHSRHPPPWENSQRVGRLAGDEVERRRFRRR